MGPNKRNGRDRDPKSSYGGGALLRYSLGQHERADLMENIVFHMCMKILPLHGVREKKNSLLFFRSVPAYRLFTIVLFFGDPNFIDELVQYPPTSTPLYVK
jgi:hypothetical protein